MQIDFYEEYPTAENLEKLKLIKFKARIFIAAQSLTEFDKIARQTNRINNKLTCAFWPIIKNSYWISPFSDREDLVKLFEALNKTKVHLLIDLEPPLNKRMIFKNIFSYHKNKKLIRAFLEENKKRITTAQFPASLMSKFVRLLGLDYDVNNEKSLMWYSSMAKETENQKVKEILRRIENKQKYSISLGTIATGVLGNEPILTPENLEKDLEFVKQAGFRKVIIFRASGLNESYIKVLNKFRN